MIFGALFTAAVWFNLGPIVALVGATGETAGLAVHYLSIIVPTLPLLLIGMVGGAILRAHGDARRAMIATVLGGTVNAVLDPILIFGFGLELTGAALASVAARLAMAAFALRPIFRHHGGLDWPSFQGVLRDFRPVVTIAFPAILTQLATPVGQAYVTRSMAQFGEDAVAGMAVVGRLTPVAFGVIFALSGAVGPIIGQNFGARDPVRVRRAYLDGILFTAFVVMVATAVLFALRGTIADLFQATGTMRALIYLFCGPLALMFFFNGMLFVSNAAFNNMGRPFWSTGINWGRHTLGTIPFVMAGGALFGAPGVLIGQAAGGVLFAVLSYWLAARLIGRHLTLDPPGTDPVAGFRGQVRLFQLFHRHR